MLHRRPPAAREQHICPAENKVVERSEIVKGYEFRKDEYIVDEPEEIKKIEPQTAKTMEILEDSCRRHDVDPVSLRVLLLR
jgi:DNA end-binding protein Ku